MKRIVEYWRTLVSGKIKDRSTLADYDLREDIKNTKAILAKLEASYERRPKPRLLRRINRTREALRSLQSELIELEGEKWLDEKN